MKRRLFTAGILALALAFLLVFSLASCVSLKDKEIDMRDQSVNVVDTVTVKFNSWQFFNIPASKRIKNNAYTKLKEAAREKHGIKADVVNIVIKGSWTPLEFIHIGIGAGLWGIGLGTGLAQDEPINIAVGGGGLASAFIIGNWQRITASGDIVLYED